MDKLNNMSKTNRNKNKNTPKAKAAKPVPQKIEEKKSKKSPKTPISGFSTLNQVVGVSKPREHHSSIPVAAPKSVKEPKLKCEICGEEIESIACSMTAPQGGYAHFDCVLESIKAEEVLAENQVVSYIGSGNFGVCEKDENGSYHIIKTINYENADRTKAIKEFVESLKI